MDHFKGKTADEDHQDDENFSPLFAMDSDASTRVEDTSLWAQDLFQLRGSSNSKKITEKTAMLGYLSVYLLFGLGVLAGLINGSILMANAALCKLQATLIIMGGSYGIGLLYFLLAMTVSVLLASLCCKYGSGECAGSGLPQFKYILASEMTRASYDSLLSVNIFVLKVIGLILSVGGGLSVGSEGPLVLIAACIAHLMMKHIVYFDDILDNASQTKQILAASAAVGLGSAFNAPVGGLLFSIEVTSTFYLVSNYWKSFLAAMAGSVACSLFLITKDGANGDPLLVVEMLVIPKLQYSKWELAIFVMIGVSFGYLANGYLYLHQKVHLFMKPHNAKRPLACAVAVAFITAFFVYITGAYTKDSVGVIALVSDVFNKGLATEMSSSGLPPMGGLFIMLIVRVFLTLLGTNILVPAGIFMPVILMGGVLGRFVGYFIYYCGHTDAFIPGYALVGAVAFSSGITHTISAAVIAVEMTGNLGMLLPCLVVAVLSAGITKSSGLSVYDQGMINRGLETFQLLLLGKHGSDRVAASVMDDKVASLPKTVRVLQLVKALELTRQTVFPVTDDSPDEKMKLVGSVLRKDVYTYLRRIFVANGLEEAITVLLRADTHEHEQREARRLKKEAQRKRDNHIINTFTTSIEKTVGQVAQSLDVSDFLFKAEPHDRQVTFASDLDGQGGQGVGVGWDGRGDGGGEGKADSNIATSINPMHRSNARVFASEPRVGPRDGLRDGQRDGQGDGVNDVQGPGVHGGRLNEGESSASSSHHQGGVALGSQAAVESSPMEGGLGGEGREGGYEGEEAQASITSQTSQTSRISQQSPLHDTGPSDSGTEGHGTGMGAASVWATVHTAAQSFMKGTMDALQFQEPATGRDGKDGKDGGRERRGTIEQQAEAREREAESAKLLSLFAFKVRIEGEAQLHLNMFPFRYYQN